MKESITLNYQQAIELAHSITLAVLGELGHDYQEMSDNIVSGIDYATQVEIDKLF